jgi:Fe2+ transport system protein FeoA
MDLTLQRTLSAFTKRAKHLSTVDISLVAAVQENRASTAPRVRTRGPLESTLAHFGIVNGNAIHFVRSEPVGVSLAISMTASGGTSSISSRYVLRDQFRVQTKISSLHRPLALLSFHHHSSRVVHKRFNLKYGECSLKVGPPSHMVVLEHAIVQIVTIHS